MKNKFFTQKQNSFAKFVLPVLLSFIILLTTVFVWMSGIYGWFANNRKAEATGMSVEVVGSPNLIISDNSTNIQNELITSVNAVSPYSISFGADTNSYRPVRSTFGDFSTYSNGLYTVSNTGSVDVVSGLQKAGSENLIYENASNTSDVLYYRDIVVYVASYSAPLNGYALSASISKALANGAPITSGSLMGLSIDFYVDSVSSSNYKGTLNVAEQEANDPEGECAALTSVDLVDDGIPLNTIDYITIIMRVYFDGALVDKDNPTRAYINTASLDLLRTSVDIRFTASEN